MSENLQDDYYEEIYPPEKLEELKVLFKDCEYKVYTCKDEGYDYLQDGYCCIASKNPSGKELYVDLEDEFSIFFDSWHSHYSSCKGEYKLFTEDLKGILNSTLYAFSIFSGGNWLASQLLQCPVISDKYIALRYINSYFYKDVISKIKQNGAEVHCVFWNDEFSNVIKFLPKEF